MENCNRTTTHPATALNTTSRRAAKKSRRKANQGTKVQFAPRCPCHDADCRDEDHSDASSWASKNYNPCHDLLESGDEDGVQEDWIIDKRFSPDQEEEIEAPGRISKVRIDLAAELFDFDDYERQVEWNDNEKLEEERKSQRNTTSSSKTLDVMESTVSHGDRHSARSGNRAGHAW